jgi:hypothetical protein
LDASAVNVKDAAAAIVSDCTFSGGSGATSKAIFAGSKPGAAGPTLLEVSGSSFVGCQSPDGGSALHIAADASGAGVAATVTASVFRGNSGGAGPVFVDGANAALTAAGITFDANTASPTNYDGAGALFVANEARAEIADSAFKSNSGRYAQAINMFLAASLSISRSQFLGALQARRTMRVTYSASATLDRARLTVDGCTFDAAPLAGESSNVYKGAVHISVNGHVDALVSRSKFVNAGAAGNGELALIAAVRGRGTRLYLTCAAAV